MIVVLRVTPHDPLVARDGRPFGVGQGNRMRGLPWPLPSVVAGAFRTALVKSSRELDFSGDMPHRLMQIAVAGVFPVHGGELYLPSPNDAVAEPDENGKRIKILHRVVPQPITGGCDLPEDGLQPVMLSESQASEDFKPAEVPAWWPIGKYAEWLTQSTHKFPSSWCDSRFLQHPRSSYRDHVSLNPDRGAAEEGQIFSTAALNVTHLPKFGVNPDDRKLNFEKRFAKVELSARIRIPDSDSALSIGQQFAFWHPLGGERRLVHWQQEQTEINGWMCPEEIRTRLATVTKVRMVLATPAIFKNGWKPGWLTSGLDGELSGVRLKLIGVSNGRWKAVSGWSLAPPRGPKPIRRMVPAGSVYFFEVENPGDAAPLADLWLQSVSDDEQEQRDGFGLAVWGAW